MRRPRGHAGGKCTAAGLLDVSTLEPPWRLLFMRRVWGRVATSLGSVPPPSPSPEGGESDATQLLRDTEGRTAVSDGGIV